MKILLVYNKYSGKGLKDKKLNKIIDSLKETFDVVDTHITEEAGDITNFIAKNGANYDNILSLGGDGSIHEAINGLMQLENKPIISFIPLGTCNDFVKNFGYKNIRKSLKIIKNGVPTDIDINIANDIYFTYALAFGEETNMSYDVSHKKKRKFGKLAYYVFGIKQIFKKSQLVTFKFNGEEYKNAFIFFASKTKHVGGFRKGGKVYFDSGDIDVCIIKKNWKPIALFKFIRFILFNRAKYKFKLKEFDIINEQITPYNIDGDNLGNFNECHVKVINKALKVLTTKKIKKKYFLNKK